MKKAKTLKAGKAKAVAPKMSKAKAVSAEKIAPKARAKMTSLASVKAYRKRRYGA